MVHCKKFKHIHTSNGLTLLNDFLKKLKPEELVEIGVLVEPGSVGNNIYTHCYVFYDQRRFMNESRD